MSRLKAILSLDTWTRGASARNLEGDPVKVLDSDATHFSLGGAFLRAYHGETNKEITSNFPLLKKTVTDYAKEKGIKLKDMNVLTFNDSKRVKWADVEEVIRRSGL